MGNHETPKVGVATIIRRRATATRTYEVLFGCRKGSHGADTWSLPGGHLDLGETIESCGIREVEEETGIVLNPATVSKVPFYSHEVFPDFKREYITLFLLAEVAEGTEAKLMEPTKSSGWVWVPRDGVPSPLFAGIPDLLAALDLWGAISPWPLR